MCIMKLDLFQCDSDVTHLKKYINKSCVSNLKNCEDIVESPQALQHLGEVWTKHKGSIMMVFTAIEYEYITKNEFTPQELRALRHFIGNLGLFFKNCAKEYERYENDT